MTDFKGYISAYGSAAAALDSNVLQSVLERYPWFTTARVLSAGTHVDRLLAMHLLSHPAPSHCLVGIPIPAVDSADGSSISDIIDSFLSKGEHKIVPDDTTPDYDAAEQSSKLELSDDDMISEELAEIYRAQGMEKEAEEILRRLRK